MTPRVSVLMPVYNGDAYVAAAVASVLASRDVDLELLLIDDGSTDNSVSWAQRASRDDPRFRVINTPHGGVARARNAGLAAARGEFIAHLDADDIAFPDRFAKQVAFLDANANYVAVGTRVLAIDANGKPISVVIRTFTHEEIDGAHLACRGGALGGATAMFRRAAAITVGGYDDTLASVAEDMDLWLRLAEVGRLANLPEVLVYYRIHDRNVSIAGTPKDERKAIARQVVERAYQRRGLPGTPVEGTRPPAARWESKTDGALLRYFNGKRAAAIVLALRAVATSPASSAARATLVAILAGPPPSSTPRSSVLQP